MPLSRDGVGSTSGFSGGTSSVVTHAVGGANQTNALMMAVISVTSPNTTPVTVTSLTDSQGNTWQRFTSQSAGAGWNTADTVGNVQRGFTLEVWYTKAAVINTSITLTINYSATIDSAVIVPSAKYLGYDPTHPFDLNGSLPAVLRANAGTTAETLTGVSTTNTHIMPVWAFGTFGTNIGTTNVTFNGVAQDDMHVLQNNNSQFVKGQLSVGVATTGPYANVSYAAATSADNYFIIGFALTADATIINPTLSRAMIVG